MAAMQAHWDIFCRVIDNFGDIGVCWRLARQLVAEHDRHVRLWVDDLGSLQALCPEIVPTAIRQTCQGVEIRFWGETIEIDVVAEVVIEAFACELPASYLAKMAETKKRPRWINLEYLTAEPWADSCHGMASPHPTLPLVKYFFFPGFSPVTGGLLREKDLLARRDADTACRVQPLPLEISLFCYDNAPVGPWLDCLATASEPVHCHVPPGKPLAAVAAHLGGTAPWQHGAATIVPVPFMTFDAYDQLLWRCDINFVRGEDSFVRAQWAAKPFVWQIYEQDEAAHLIKLRAFLDSYLPGMSNEAATAASSMFMAWNTGQDPGPAWADFLAVRHQIAAHNHDWARQLAAADDLTTTLIKFCASKV